MLRQLSVEEICKKLKPIFGKKIDNLYLQYVMADSREGKDEIAHMLNALYNKNLNQLLDTKVLLEPPRKQDVEGEYGLADVSYSGKKLFQFALREKDWPRHVCISGMSGSGKTTFAFNVLQSLIDNGKNFLVFDWKQSFRPLLKASSDVMIFTVGKEDVSNIFKMNINQPPKGIDPKEWINVLADLLVESFSASYGVHKVLLETLDEAFVQFGVYEGSGNYPTWDQIKWYLEEKMNKAKGRESGWLESALRIASVLTFGNFGKIVSSKNEGSLNVEDLLDKRVILELNALSNIEKKFFCEFILAYIYKFKKANKRSVDGKFDHAILVDEAHNIFLKDHTNFAKESVTDMIYREMREYGTSLICLDQHISKLSDTIKGNSACHIAFQQQLPQDIYDISGLMQLRDNKEYFSMLPVGSAIVKLSERYTQPFLVEVSPVKIRETYVSDEDVKGRARVLVSGISVMKGQDEEFKQKLVQTPVNVVRSRNEQISFEVIKPVEKKVEVKPIVKVEKPVVKVEKPVDDFEKLNEIIADGGLSAKQKVLYEYVAMKVKEGKNLIELEDLMETYKDEGRYTSYDVGRVINHALRQSLYEKGHNVVTLEKQNIYKAKQPLAGSEPSEKAREVSSSKELDTEQEMFLSFLQKNLGAELGTVDVYKSLGFSPRKGNKIKKQLEEQGKIIIEEKKNEKGWKKIIRLSK